MNCFGSGHADSSPFNKLTLSRPSQDLTLRYVPRFATTLIQKEVDFHPALGHDGREEEEALNGETPVW